MLLKFRHVLKIIISKVGQNSSKLQQKNVQLKNNNFCDDFVRGREGNLPCTASEPHFTYFPAQSFVVKKEKKSIMQMLRILQIDCRAKLSNQSRFKQKLTIINGRSFPEHCLGEVWKSNGDAHCRKQENEVRKLCVGGGLSFLAQHIR